MLVALHADDLGFSSAINAGICDALRRGLLTGASVLANAPEAGPALAAWRRIDEERRDGGLPSGHARRLLGDPPRPFDLGVHLNLSQGRPLTGEAFPGSLLDGDGNFPGLATFLRLMLPGASRHAAAVRRELAAQIEFVLDHAVRPVRLDGHQYGELTPLVGRIVHELAALHGIQGVRVAREPGLGGTLLRARGVRGAAGLPAALAKRLLAAAYHRSTSRTRLHHAAWFFGSVTAGRVGIRDLERFLALGARCRASLIEVGLHPALPAVPATPDPRQTQAALGPWIDPLADVRPNEHHVLTGAALPELLLGRGVRLGRLG